MAKDTYHGVVRRALEADGWTITHDPLTLKFGEQSVFVDLGAEGPIGAEKEDRQIAVEVKSFLGPSSITEMERALGQYGFYNFLLARQDAGRTLYIAMPEPKYLLLFETADGRDLLRNLNVRVIVFDDATERIVQWKE